METTNPFNDEKKPQGNLFWFLLAFIIILAAFLRFFQIDSESFWWDESITAELVQLDFNTLIEDHLSRGRPPLQVLLAYFWVNLFDTSELAARSLSAIFGVAAIPLMYLVGDKLFGRKVALISTFFMSIAYIHILHSQTFRYYSVVVFLVLAAAYFFIRGLEKGRWQDFLLFSLFGSLAIYAHYMVVFVLAAWGVFALLYLINHRKIILPWFISQVLILAIGSLPIAALISKRLSEDGNPVGRDEVNTALSVKFYDPFQTIFRFMFGEGTFTNWQSRVPVAALILLLLIGYIYLNRKTWFAHVRQLPVIARDLMSNSRDNIIFVVLWLFLPVVLLTIYSLVISPLYNDRYLIGASPALYILMALIIVKLQRVIPVILSIGAVTFFGAVALSDYYLKVDNDQWREAANYVIQHAEPDDAIYIPIHAKVFYWYYPETEQQCYTNKLANETGLVTNTDDVKLQDLEPEAFADCDRVWIVLRYTNRFNKEGYLAEMDDILNSAGYQLTESEIAEFHYIDVLLYERDA